MKKVLFVNPSLRLNSQTKFLPVGIASVMTFFSKQSIEFDFLDVDINDLADNSIEEFLGSHSYDIILSGSIVTHYKWMKWFVNMARRYNPSSKIIIGNSVAGSIPEIFLKNCSADIAIVGEGEITTAEVVKKIIQGEDWFDEPGIAYKTSNGKIKINEKRKSLKKLDEFPMIDWQHFETEKYFKKSYAGAHAINDGEVRVMPVVTARGCAFKCTFCHYVFWNDPYRYRSPENIVSEIQRNISQFDANYITFWDDLSFASLPQAERFADKLLDSGLRFNWNAAVRVDLFGNPKHPRSRRLEVAQKFKQAGCMDLGYSLESANEEILKMMNKRIRADYFLEQARILEEVGIHSSISVVFGYPIETSETIRETFQMCYDANIYPSMGYLLPLPATGMYEYAKKQKYITDDDKYLDSITERQDLCINMTSMSDEKVKRLIAEGADDLNSKLGIGLGKERLIKTGGYNQHSKANKVKKLKRDKNSLILNYSEAEFESNLGVSYNS